MQSKSKDCVLIGEVAKLEALPILLQSMGVWENLSTVRKKQSILKQLS
ncbi:MAG: hypothetical protein V3T88_07005 [Nitrosomonadaceae bacterium]